MWQPRQTLANNSSPLISTNLKSWLSAGLDDEGPALCAYTANDSGESAADRVMAQAVRSLVFPEIIWWQNSALKTWLSGFDRALVQSRDGVKRRQDGALLPRWNVGGMLARQHDPAVDLAEIVVMLRPRLVAPVAGATQCKGHAMPGHRDAVLEFGAVLWMNAGADLDRAGDPLGRRHRGEFVGVGTVEQIGAEQHAPAGAIEAGVGIGDLPDRQIGIADTAIDRVVLLPEPAPELQADLDRSRIGHRVDRRLHAVADVDLKLAQDRERYGADAPIGLRLLRRGRCLEVGVGDRDTAVVLLDPGYLGVVANEVADFLGKRLADHVHAADRLKHRGLEGMQRKVLQVTPEPRVQDLRQIDRLARDRHCIEAAAGIPGVAAKVTGNQICLVGIVAVQRAP